MTTSLRVRFYDGQSSQAHLATLTRGETNDHLQITWQDALGEAKTATYRTRDGDYLPAVGQVVAAYDFLDGARLEFIDGVPDWLNLGKGRAFDHIHRLEKSWRWVAISLVVIVGVFYGLIKYALPAAAHELAWRLPADTLMAAGDEAEDYLYKLTKPSQLSADKQAHIRALYAKINPNPKAKIVIRQGGDELEANAFAIPNNTIVITDELIQLSGHDDEILAVLAHEQGHLVHRHSLQQSLSSLGISLIVVSITGDTSDLLVTLPTLLATSHYSQEFELEADNFAIQELKKLGISPLHLANFFEKMDTGHDHPAWDILSSHPSTDKRINNAKEQAH